MTLQEMIAASQAANPNAAGANGTLFAYGSNNPAAPPDLGTHLAATQGGYTPDYAALLASDPQLVQAQADSRAALGGSAAARKAATAKILAQLGIVPDFGSALNTLGLNSSYLASDIDPTTAALAQQLTDQGLSTEAQLGHSHDVNVNSLVDQLAARHTLQSGSLGVGLTQENQRDKQAHYDALSAALSQIGAAQTGYAGDVQSQADQLRAASEAAAQRQIQLHPYVAGTQVDANYDAATGLYKDPDGNFYNADGSATKPGAANALTVHPSNVQTPPATPLPSPHLTSGTTVGQTAAAAVPKASIPGAPPALVSENGYRGASSPVPSAAPLLVSENGNGSAPAATGVPRAAAQSVQNSLVKRLNLPQ